MTSAFKNYCAGRRFVRTACIVASATAALVVVLMVVGYWLSYPKLPPRPTPVRPSVIAHAGGAINGTTYTNSREALDLNYARGHRHFEIDFSWTSDNELVAVHDWTSAWPSSFENVDGVPELEEFQAAKMKHGLHQMTLDDIVEWFAAHPDAFLITDVKNRNIEALRTMADRARPIVRQIIPQIYESSEYEMVLALEFGEPPILTLYRSRLWDNDVVRFVAAHEVFAVTMPAKRTNWSNLAQRLRAGGIFVYAHTVNDATESKLLMQRGVCGFYSDDLLP